MSAHIYEHLGVRVTIHCPWEHGQDIIPPPSITFQIRRRPIPPLPGDRSVRTLRAAMKATHEPATFNYVGPGDDDSFVMEPA